MTRADEHATQIIRHSQPHLHDVEDEQVPGESDNDEPAKQEAALKPRRRRKRDHRRIVVNTFGTKYPVVVQVCTH